MSLRGRLNQYATDWRDQMAQPRLRKPTKLPAPLPDTSDGVDAAMIIVVLVVVAAMTGHFIAKHLA
jgi:hypothetical protein